MGSRARLLLLAALLGAAACANPQRQILETGESQAHLRSIQSRVFDTADLLKALDLAEGPLVVHGNPVMLGQVAMNLIVNACEVQPGKGEVRVTSRRDGAHVVAEFADRGPGIPEADRQRVFEPFFSTRDSTGLGLSICHTIVRQHDGELEVAAREGGGSVFRMRLPVIEG